MHIHRLFNPEAFRGGQCSSDELTAQPWVLAIGNFDGVHHGHQLIIKTLHAQAQRLNALPAVMIFEPQPLEYFLGDGAPIRLMGVRDKVEALFEQGIQQVLVCGFDLKLSQMLPEDFMLQLRKSLNLKGLTQGQDFKFGYKRLGNLTFLQQYCDREHIQLEVMPDFNMSEVRVSSSLIRQYILQSDFNAAQKSLGHPFRLSGLVEHGRQLARTMGFPTANLRIFRRVPPMKGVFVGWAYLPYNRAASVAFKAVANCGWKPSVNGEKWQVEVHIFDEDFQAKSLYGIRISFEPLARIRDEKKFDSIELLRQAIETDIEDGRAYFLKCTPKT